MGTKFPRVLVVDDDPNARALCSINLLLEGLEVLEAEDGRRGLARARLESPDLVVTDVAMPGLNGFELAEALRSDEGTARIPLIFLSGEIDPANEARAHSLGALAYVTKPFDPPALAKLVAGALSRLGPREPPVATD
jgi:CheY-like chemotaxis protein